MALSRVEHVYAAEETTFGVMVPADPDDALKVVEPGATMKAEQANIRGNEKTGSRSQAPSMRCGSVAGTVEVPLYVEPSGVPGTKPDGKALYKNLMGAEEVINTTVVSAADASTITLASATGIHAGSLLGIGAAIRPVLSLAGAVATMGAPFPTVPAGGALVKAVNYILADPVPSTLSVYSYIQEMPHVAVGSVFNQGVFSFIDELLHLALTGFCTDVIVTGLPAEPTPIYTGSPLAKGCGAVFIDGVSAPLLDMTVTINNNDVPREIPVGKTVTSGISRGLRQITDTFTIYLDAASIPFYTAAKNRTNQTLFIQIGDVAGRLFGMWLPQRILQTPDIDKTNPEIQFNFTADAWGYANEEMVIGFA